MSAELFSAGIVFAVALGLAVVVGGCAWLDRRNRSRARAEVDRRVLDAVASALPLDRSPTQLTNDLPEGSEHTELKENGQQLAYVVLSPEERARGFVRPVRHAYQHVGVRPKFPTRPLTAEEAHAYAKQGYVCFEVYPESETPRTGRFWTHAQLYSGCGVVTRMSTAIAETYARDPKFYGGTFCLGCGKHLPVEEFVWLGTNERVGS